MKTTNLVKAVLVIAASAALMITACKKKDKPTPDPEPTPVDSESGTASDNQAAEMFVSDIESAGSQATETGTLNTYRSSSGAAIEMALCATVTPNASARIYTVDFGTTGCTGQDGRVRTGKLVFDCSASASSALYYRNPGFVMSVTAHNYVVDGHTITINNKTVSNTTPLSIPSGTNPGTNLTWSITADVSIQKPSNGGTITWNCNRTKELINTSDPNCYRGQGNSIVWSKAQVKLNGSASGTNAKSESFTSTATNLVRDFNCKPDPIARPRWSPFVSGTLAYTPGSRPTRVIDYGTGACDQAASVTINGTVFTIVLP